MEKPMIRLVILATAEMHKMLERGAKKRGVSKAGYTRLLITKGKEAEDAEKLS